MNEQIVVPPRLYKYQPYNNQTLNNLKNRIIWFSKPFRFNDPFDCEVNFNFEKTTEENWKILYQQFINLNKDDDTNQAKEFAETYFREEIPNDEFIENAAKHLGNVFEEGLKIDFSNRGIACFSEKIDDILTWSHYANGHTGFCLEFDTTYHPFSLARPVKYRKGFPLLNLSNNRKEIMWDLVTTKSLNWAYEKEWRLFHEEGDKEFRIDPNSISGIFFGCNMPEANKRALSTIIAGRQTKCNNMITSKEEFKVYSQEVGNYQTNANNA